MILYFSCWITVVYGCFGNLIYFFGFRQQVFISIRVIVFMNRIFKFFNERFCLIIELYLKHKVNISDCFRNLI